jgi:hypothetical protein
MYNGKVYVHPSGIRAGPLFFFCRKLSPFSIQTKFFCDNTLQLPEIFRDLLSFSLNFVVLLLFIFGVLNRRPILDNTDFSQLNKGLNLSTFYF